MNVNLENHQEVFEACKQLLEVPSIRDNRNLSIELLRELQRRIEYLTRSEG
jgi:hypothetical protein